MLLTLFATALLAAPQQSSSALPPLRDPSVPFGHVLHLPGGERLLEYAWDGGLRVPSLAAERDVFVPFGERGLDARTRLYLPGNSALEVAATGAAFLEQRGVSSAPGRLGPGLDFTTQTLLRVALPPQAPGANGWTLSFWVQPGAAAFGRPLVVLPGALEVVLLGDGRPRAHLLPSGEEITHTSRLGVGEWSHLSVAYDPTILRQMRLVVDGVSLNVGFAVPAPARIASELLAGDLARNGRGFAGKLDELALEALPHATAEVDLTARRALSPGSHALELVTTRGLRTVTLAAGATRELWLDTPAELALGQLDGVALANGELRWAPGRWRTLPTRGAPPPRTTHPTVSLGAGRVWTFGGETRDTHRGPMLNTSDTWVLDLARARWEQVATSPAPAPAPAPRCHVPAAYSPDHDLVLLQGGWKNDATPHVTYSDTWVYHVGAGRWEQRFPAGAPGPGGSDFGLVYLPSLGKFVLFHPSRTYLYDPSADTWEARPQPQAETESGQPTSYTFKSSSMCALDPVSGHVLVFGGHYGPGASLFSDETVLYDVTRNVYVVLDPPTRPSARVRSGFAYDSRRGLFVLFGGVQDQFSQRHDDLWVFDPRTRLWHELPCSNRPSPRGGFYGMAYDEGRDEFVLTLGRSTPQLWLDDTQVLTLRPSAAGSALYTFDRVEGRNRRTWSADVTTPGNSRVVFFFRRSNSGASFGPWQAFLPAQASERYVQVAALLVPGSAGEVPSIQRMGLR